MYSMASCAFMAKGYMPVWHGGLRSKSKLTHFMCEYTQCAKALKDSNMKAIISFSVMQIANDYNYFVS